MMFWGDIIQESPELVPELPPDIIALEWGYEADHPFDKHCRRFAKAGIPFYVCPGTSSWNTLTGRTGNCLANLMGAARGGLRHGAAGYLITDWGDGGHHQYLPISYPGFVAGAAYSWCLRANLDMDAARGIDRHIVDDSAGVLGSILTELGRLYQALPVQRPNRTAFNDLLFGGTDSVASLAAEIGGVALRRSERGLAALEERLSEARPACPDGALAKDEIAGAIAMTRLGVRRGLAALGENVPASEMRRELRRVIGRHEHLWLARNRHGGLHESSARLRDVLVWL
jgi:hexosaminidase